MAEILRVGGEKSHFELLDGLRGVAALAVVLHHSWRDGGIVSPNGWLAVDFFFLLSGFVIAYSYEDRVLAGMSFKEFVIRRIIRLYPMILVGAGGGVMIALLHNLTNPANAYPMHSLALSGFLSFFLIPYFGHDLGSLSFSFNPPLWSLSYEVLANIFYVAMLRFLSSAVLGVLVVLGFLAMIFAIPDYIVGHLGFGQNGPVIFSFAQGLPRILCGFFGGVLLYRLVKTATLPKVPINFLGLSFILVAVFASPLAPTHWILAFYYLIFVAVILLAASARTKSSTRLCTILGLISYPLYLIHWTTLYIFQFIGNRIGLQGQSYNITAWAHLVFVAVLAYGFALWYDQPVRRWLTAAWRTKRAVEDSAKLATSA